MVDTVAVPVVCQLLCALAGGRLRLKNLVVNFFFVFSVGRGGFII